ncbi:glycerol kinase, putative [Entamoeba dispar SAW760]|uniref:glycerol kinase n=1 Tax=Entamoeba dispar (strain ATCC PRA-260 / SAW760) TaxID=370354 RepID=B0EGQ6_ENTDS|nr:glycerol kinase, putative [Entamoeba dispar SAW760]EDR26296.1 glycerol kinase, putative [Entamoeba dispar SAW760]|eukprot:EDR26296.1 glycerol kinase, putative [Entamoeba dispar SAW760]
MKYILAIDQGTTSTRVILFDEKCQSVHTEQEEFDSIFPHPGWVEQDPEIIYTCVVNLMKRCLVNTGINKQDIAAIGITNQRETTVMWDKRTGKPIYNAIVWQSKQSGNETSYLMEKGYGELFHSKTGLVLNPYFSASKIMWIFNHVECAKALAKEGVLLFGTIDTWIIYNLTGGQSHFTDISNAARTLLFNIYEKKWDDELLVKTDIPKSILPVVKQSSDDFGIISTIQEFNGIHITGVAGDQQASLFGHGSPIGGCKSTYGTGCFVVKNIGNSIKEIPKGLLATIGWEIDGKITYALEGSVMTAGAALKWIRDIGILKDYNEISKIVPSKNGGVYFVPAFQGLGTPYWDDDVRGIIVGLTSGTGKGELVRATLESIALQCAQVIEIMGKINEIKVDGGVSRSDCMLQFQADICNCTVVRLKEKEITAMGAAMLAGLYIHLFKEDELDSMRVIEHIFKPQMSEEERKQIFSLWNKAVESARSFVH